jgi:hypothetical protein
MSTDEWRLMQDAWESAEGGEAVEGTLDEPEGYP